MEHDECTHRLFSAWLDVTVAPLTPEHRLLQALWQVSDEGERGRLVRLFLRARGRDLEA